MRSIYDLAIYKPWSYFFQYPLAVIFLIDHHLTWRFREQRIRGDVATNISTGPARVLGLIGGLMRILSWKK